MPRLIVNALLKTSCFLLIHSCSGFVELESHLALVKVHDDAATNIQVVGAADGSAFVCHRSGSGSGTPASALHPFPGICSHVHFNGSALSKGPDLIIGSSSFQGLSITQLSSFSIACFNPDWTSRLGVRCSAFRSSGSSLSRVADITVAESYALPWSTDNDVINAYPNIRTTRMSGSTAVVCYQKELNDTFADAGVCAHLRISNNSMAKVSEVVLGSTWKPLAWTRETGGKPLESISLTSFSENTSIACYNKRHWSPWYKSALVCNVLNTSAHSLQIGPDVILMADSNSYVATEIRLVQLTSAHGVVCYRLNKFDPKQPYPGRCVQLRLADFTLKKGHEVTLASVSSRGLSVAAFSNEVALACYTPLDVSSDNAGLVCNSLRVSGTFLLRGPKIVVDERKVTNVHVHPMSNGSGILCYRRETASSTPSYPGVCAYIQLCQSEGLERIFPGSVIRAVSHGGLHIAVLSSNRAMACYNPRASKGMELPPSSNLGLACDVISIHNHSCRSSTLYRAIEVPMTSTTVTNSVTRAVSVLATQAVSVPVQMQTTTTTSTSAERPSSTEVSFAIASLRSSTTEAMKVKPAGRPALSTLSRCKRSASMFPLLGIIMYSY